MKKMLISLLSCFFIFGHSVLVQSSSSSTVAQGEVPDYAKWGQLAVKKTMNKYPNATIIDYLHVGKVTGSVSSTEKFKLWLKEADKEFGVLIEIEYDNQTGKLIHIIFSEVSK